MNETVLFREMRDFVSLIAYSVKSRRTDWVGT